MQPAKPASPHQNCRESRPVPFYAESEIWSAVHDGVITSVDVDHNMQFNPPARAESRVEQACKVGFQLQRKPVMHKAASRAVLPKHKPLEDATVRVLTAELRKAESEIAALRKHLSTQNQVIDGLCKLHVGKENA